MSPPKLYSYNHLSVSLPLIFLLIFPLINHSDSQGLQDICDPHDKSVLFRIKNFWGNPSSLAYWDPNVDCCQWNYMQCDDQGHISTFRISLVNDIHGPIPPFLDDLRSLTYLQFDNMYNLSGPIPSYIGKLTNLTTFVLAGTNVGGAIPKFLAQLTSLTRLELTASKLTGLIPDFLSELKNLTYLDLSSNKLAGSIPPALAKLTRLSSLYLGFNKLSGQIPDFLAQLTLLDTLALQFNQLSGPIPISLGRTPNLITLWLRNNKLSGDASFLFDKNNTAIKYIDVHYNRLKFDFSNVDLARNIWNLDISHNQIYGSLPLKFGLLDPQAVDVSYNQLCGPIPNGRRFKRANPDIFAHNKCLCGGPLPACKK